MNYYRHYSLPQTNVIGKYSPKRLDITFTMKRANIFSHIFLYLIASCFFQACKKQDAGDIKLEPIDSTPIVTSVLKPVTFSINNKISGFYVALPSNYGQTTDKYPLLLFMPGAGQFGNGSLDLPLLLNAGPVQLVDEKVFPGTFHVNDKDYSFIVLTPQPKAVPFNSDIADCIDFAKSRYRIDSTRIYLSGLSLGGVAICNLAAAVPSKIAAIVSMAGVSLDYASTDKCEKIANNNLPVWAFHCEDDPTINVSNSKGFISKIASYRPAIMPKLTIWPNGGHDAWTRALNPSYKENGMNIYEWMLQYHR